jgi:hypothetical protein
MALAVRTAVVAAVASSLAAAEMRVWLTRRDCASVTIRAMNLLPAEADEDVAVGVYYRAVPAPDESAEAHHRWIAPTTASRLSLGAYTSPLVHVAVLPQLVGGRLYAYAFRSPDSARPLAQVRCRWR